MDTPADPTGESPMVAWLKRLKATVRANRLLPGTGYKMRETAFGTTLEIHPGTGGDSVSPYRVKQHFGEYLVCRSWDGTAEGTADVYVAKPPDLRFSVTEETMLDGSVQSYGAYDEADQSRTVTSDSDGVPATENITPPYLPNQSVIYAVSCQTLVKIDDPNADPAADPVPQISLTLMDTNAGARAWGEP